MSQVLPERRATAPERREPFSELDQVTERVRRMLEQTFAGFAWPSPLVERERWSPLVDIEETDNANLLEAELPGVKGENVSIELVGNELTITGEMQRRRLTAPRAQSGCSESSVTAFHSSRRPRAVAADG